MKSPTRLTSFPTSSAIRPPLKMPRIFDVWSVWEPEDFVLILLIVPDRWGSCWCWESLEAVESRFVIGLVPLVIGLVPREAGSDTTSTFSASLLVFRDPLPKELSAKSFVSIPFCFLLLLRSRKGFIRAWNGLLDGDGDRLAGGDRLMAMLGNPIAVGELGAVVSYSADVRTGVSSKLDLGLRF